MTGKPFNESARVFVENRPDRIGRKYLKAVYRAYTDDSFSTRRPHPVHLGVVGPSVHPHGVFYDKASEGAPYADGITVDMERVTNVAYDIRIWLVKEDSSTELVYEREAIRETAHKLEVPLAPSSKYFWSVRARFDLDGKTRVSEWSLSLYPGRAYYNPREVARKTGRIPTANYYRFKTPD